MEKIRKPFQGVLNIVRFNWHFYVIVIMICLGLFSLKNIFPLHLHYLFTLAIIFAFTITSITLIVSCYVYDLSGLYKLNWLASSKEKIEIVNINAGFDETTELLKIKFAESKLTVLDFYDPLKHTEISIKRARKAYPAFPNTITTTTFNLPLQTNSADKIFVIFAAHEIREVNERIDFFKELNRIIKTNGEIYVTEHLRDLPNFLAYNIGFIHFHSKKTWYNSFANSGLVIKCEQNLNPFITNFTLTKNGITS